MSGKELRVGFACTGSFCTFGQMFPAMEETAKRFGTVIPILSEYSGRHRYPVRKGGGVCRRNGADLRPAAPEQHHSSRAHWAGKAAGCAGHRPCTGNTLAKMGGRRYGQLGDHGRKGSPAQRAAGAVGDFHQRWIGGLSAQSGGAELPEKYLPDSLPPG